MKSKLAFSAIAVSAILGCGTPSQNSGTSPAGGRTSTGGSLASGGSSQSAGRAGSGGIRSSGGATGSGGSGTGGTAFGSSGGAAGKASGGTTGGGSGGSRDGAVDAPVTDAWPADAPARDSSTGTDGIAATVTFNPGGTWNDTTGTPIQAHGGGFLKVGDTWYWVGEDKTTNTGGSGFFYAVSLYASKDLVTWEHRNKIITSATDPQLASNRIIEPPKIIYNDKTKMYVLWAHWADTAYTGCDGGAIMSVNVCDTLDIDMSLSGTVWTQTVTDEQTNQSVSYSIDMKGQAQNLAYFVIEEYSSAPVSEVIFTDTILTFDSSDATDCKVSMRGQTDYVSSPAASGDGLQCSIPQIILRAQGIQ
jgi:hypothetical protein